MTGGIIAATGSVSGSEASATGLAISLLVLLYVLYRQRQVRRLRTSWGLPVVLLLIGVLSLSQTGHGGLGSTTRVLILVALLVGDAAALGAVRALTVRLWQSGGEVYRQGTWLTVGLWLLGAAIHAVVDALAGISDSTLLLYMGATLIAQRLVLQARASQMVRMSTLPPGSAT